MSFIKASPKFFFSNFPFVPTLPPNFMFSLFSFYVSECFACIMSMYHVYTVTIKAKRASDSLEL